MRSVCSLLLKPLSAVAIGALASLPAHAATLSPSTANSTVHDPQYGSTSKVVSSSPQDGQNVTALSDMVALMAQILPPGKATLPTVDVKTADGHEYVFTPLVAPALSNGSAVTALGTWTVSRDGVVVCSSCQGWSSFTQNGDWIGVLDATGQLGNAWTVMLDGTRVPEH